ncbi:hypothetical protein [Amycolatopsis sp. NPDC051903]|uniref:hypothetical protein n=1 Tax=Amycolatopsis sp. NPDC051903 TaxID=3363936 RepID=UPI00378EDA77
MTDHDVAVAPDRFLPPRAAGFVTAFGALADRGGPSPVLLGDLVVLTPASAAFALAGVAAGATECGRIPT